MKDPQAAILIVGYESAGLLEKCLGSLSAFLQGVRAEICVVDNASKDETAALLKSRFPDVIFVRNQQNLGFAKALNQGLFETSAPYVLWLNPDTEHAHGRLAEWIEYLEKNPGVAILGPQLLNSNGSREYSARPFPSYEHYFFGRYSPLTKLFPKNPVSRKFLASDTDPAKIRDVDWVSGACLFHRRSLVREIGLLDEGFFMYFEEVDFCRRAKERGGKVQYHPAVSFRHRIGGSSRQRPAASIVWRHQSNWRYYQKYFRRHPFKDPLIAAGLALRCAFQILCSRLKSRQPS